MKRKVIVTLVFDPGDGVWARAKEVIGSSCASKNFLRMAEEMAEVMALDATMSAPEDVL